MDAFFASVEQKDHLPYRGKPLVVSGDNKRAVVAAASYEARKYGIYSAMPLYKAKEKCKELIVAKPRFGRYKEISGKVIDILHTYTDLVEPLSLDEAYLDVTVNKKGVQSAKALALSIKDDIKNTTGLTCSAGISINKFLAKIASDLRKPDGFAIIGPDMIDSFVKKLPVPKFFGIGKATEDKFKALNIHTGADMQKLDLPELIFHFGKHGQYYYNVCRGVDHREVQTNRERKSISVERTYEHDLKEMEEIMENLNILTELLEKALVKRNIKGKTVTVKIKYHDFKTITRSKTLEKFVQVKGDLMYCVENYLLNDLQMPFKIRLLGMGVSNLENENHEQQLSLFS